MKITQMAIFYPSGAKGRSLIPTDTVLYATKALSCSNSGLSRASTQIHIRNMKIVCSENQSKLTLVKLPEATGSSAAADESLKLRISILGDDVTAAEIIWAGRTAISNYSFRSCDGIVESFRSMLKCPMANKMTLSRTRLSYSIGDGLVLDPGSDLIALNRSFSLQHEETTQAQMKKQMGLPIRY